MMAKNVASFVLLVACFVCGINNPSAANNRENTGLNLSISSGISSYEAPKNTYLATQAGAGPTIYDLYVNDPKHEYQTYGGRIGYRFSANPLSSYSDFFNAFETIEIYADYEQAGTEHDEFVGLVDPDGSTLIVPIPTGDVFSISAPNNEITEAQYGFDYKYYRSAIGLKGTLKTSKEKISLKPYAYLDYSQSQSKNSFDGRIDFFFRDFAYDTKIKVQSFNPTIGLDTSYALSSKINLNIGGKYAYNINRGRGRDSLFFTGFGTQEIEMKNDRPTHSFGAQAGASYKVFPALTLELQGKYDIIGNAPQVDVRQEGKQSDFTYDSSKIISGTLRATVNF